jgi:hypothetical protein
MNLDKFLRPLYELVQTHSKHAGFNTIRNATSCQTDSNLRHHKDNPSLILEFL